MKQLRTPPVDITTMAAAHRLDSLLGLRLMSRLRKKNTAAIHNMAHIASIAWDPSTYDIYPAIGLESNLHYPGSFMSVIARRLMPTSNASELEREAEALQRLASWFQSGGGSTMVASFGRSGAGS